MSNEIIGDQNYCWFSVKDEQSFQSSITGAMPQFSRGGSSHAPCGHIRYGLATVGVKKKKKMVHSEVVTGLV